MKANHTASLNMLTDVIEFVSVLVFITTNQLIIILAKWGIHVRYRYQQNPTYFIPITLQLTALQVHVLFIVSKIHYDSFHQLIK